MQYDTNWAQGIVEALRRKHPRGLALLCEYLQLTDKHLRAYLKSGNPTWVKLRELAKTADKWLEKDTRNGNYLTFVQCFHTQISKSLGDRVDSLLDQHFKRIQGKGTPNYSREAPYITASDSFPILSKEELYEKQLTFDFST